MVYGLIITIIKTKTKNNITKSMSLLFYRAVYHSKNNVIPHSVIAAILDIILNFKTQKKTIICQSNSPYTTTVENYQKMGINCDQVEFCFKMAAILDTILNI